MLKVFNLAAYVHPRFRYELCGFDKLAIVSSSRLQRALVRLVHSSRITQGALIVVRPVVGNVWSGVAAREQPEDIVNVIAKARRASRYSTLFAV